MKRIRLIITVLILSFGALSAQTEFRPGYVVKSEGDTLFGLISYRDYIRMGRVCVFKKDKKSKKNTFYPAEILAYRFIDGKYFVTKTVNDEKVFLECLIKGKLNIFQYRNNRTDHFYFEKDSVLLTELPYEDISKKDSFGNLVVQKDNKYIGLLNYYLKDAPGIQLKIEDIKLLERKKLISLAEYYHNAVFDGEKSIIYEKNLPAIKLSFEAAGGIFMRSFRRYDPQNLWIANGERTYSKTSNMSGEVIAHICIPRINENVYLRTGVCYYELNGKDNSYLWKFKSSSLYIPIQLEYVYSIGFIQPKIAVGFDYFTSQYNSDQPKSSNLPYDIDPNILDLLDGARYNGAEFLITVGANIKIVKNLSWSLNYHLGGTQSLTTGLLIRL